MSELVYRVTALMLAITYMTVRSVAERKLGRGAKASQLRDADPRDRLELITLSIGMVLQWVYMLSRLLDFAAMNLPGWARLAGALIAVLGIALFAWTHKVLAGNWSPFVQAPPAGTLVTEGPYRWVRHPMYSSFFVYNGGMWLLTSNWIAGAPAFLAFTWMYFHRVGREERTMLETFGDQYAHYAHHTGRVVPGIGRGRLG